MSSDRDENSPDPIQELSAELLRQMRNEPVPPHLLALAQKLQDALTQAQKRREDGEG